MCRPPRGTATPEKKPYMKLIKPSEISARILTLLEESDERVIVVSPYMNISKWYKLVNKFNGLKTRRIPMEIYVRDAPDNLETYRNLDHLALQYKKIRNLHCKLYLNEKYGIVTSMNLLLSSEIHALEIGYATETWTEYNELLQFYHRYIRNGDPVNCDIMVSQPTVDMKEFMNSVREELDRNAKNSWHWLAENTLHISTGRMNYRVSINNGKLRITARIKITSGKMQKSFQPSSSITKKVKDLTTMKVEIHHGLPDLMELSGLAQHTLKSTSITEISEAETAYITDSVIRFINATDDLVLQ
jgi:hypothetical protein